MRAAGKVASAGSVLILIGGFSGSAWSAAGYNYSGYKWPDGDIPVGYYAYTGVPPPLEIPLATYVDAVRRAFQKWEDVPTSYMAFRYRGETASFPPDLDAPDGRNIVGWAEENLGTSLAVTVYWVIGNSLTEWDIGVNKGLTWTASTPTPFTAFDLHTVLLHEAGHTLSLDDVYDSRYSDQVMFGYISRGEMKRVLGEGDRAGITFIYPKQADLTISEVAGPSSALEREEIELRATVRNLGAWATSSCRLEFYLSVDSVVDARDTLLGGDVIPSLSGGETYEARVPVSVPVVISERDYHVCAVADAEEAIGEASEENNSDCYFPLKVWSDSDADGLPNWWEIKMSLNAYDATGNDGAEGDPDGEGLTNSQEYDNGTNPHLSDTDGDGQSDRDEILAGTDPSDDGSVFRVAYVSIDGQGSERWVRIAWQTISGKKYQVFYKDRMGVAWMPLGPLHTGTGGLMTKNDPEGVPLPSRYYSIEVR